MKKTIFKGIATALVTPFNEKGVDYEQFARLIDWQIEEGINALVVAVAREREAEVSERLRVLEEIWDRYDVYDKKGN